MIGDIPPTSIAAAAAAGLLSYYYFFVYKKRIRSCCPGQSHGFLPQDANYACKGIVKRIDDSVRAYVVGSGKRSVVIIHDIFGLHTGRLKQIADEIASRGFLVVAPDFFETNGGGLYGKVELGFGSARALLSTLWALLSGKMRGYMRDHPWDPLCERVWSSSVAPWLKKQGCNSASIVSFCWGAYPALHIAAAAKDPKLDICANVTYHPSFPKVASMFGEDEDAILRAAAKVPFSAFSTSMEPKSWHPGGNAERTLREAGGVVAWEQVSQMHGFMTRGDMKSNLGLAKEVERCLNAGIAFIEKQNSKE